MAGKIIGIDLGTTNSAVAVIEGGKPGRRSLSGRWSPPTLIALCPSVVGFGRAGERLIGQVARRQAVVNPENTIFSIKRLMGRRVDDPQLARVRQILPYKIVGGPGGDARVHIPQTGRTYTPQEISAMLLIKLKQDAEAYLGEPVTQAVITVPACFNDSQRQATRDAGRIAGLDVLRIINEPTAAALAYGLGKGKPETIMVFDLGGGTLDVSILDVGGGAFQVRATSGDTFLGGDDWDGRVADYLVSDFMHEHGIDLRRDRYALLRIREAAEKSRIALSSVTETEISLPFIAAGASGPQHLQVRLTRTRLEELTADLVQRCVSPVEQALKDAALQASDLDQVVFVGRATHMPMIQALVHRLIGRKPNKSINPVRWSSPHEMAAIGAAVQAGVLSGDVNVPLLFDVTPLTLGIETLGGVMTPLIKRNTTVPVRKSHAFTTTEDGQPAVVVHVLQGEHPMARDNTLLGQFKLEGILPAPRGVPQIQVTFDIDANGILNVSALDQTAGCERKLVVTASTNLSDGDVERMARESRQREAEDRFRKVMTQARNEADEAIYQVAKVLRDLHGCISVVDRSSIELVIQDLRVVKESSSVERIHMMIARLQQVSSRIFGTLPGKASKWSDPKQISHSE